MPNRQNKLGLTEEQKQIYKQCHKKAETYFNLQPGWVLHHIDVNLWKTDLDRYIRWFPEDLVPMLRSDHQRLHVQLYWDELKKDPDAFKARHYNWSQSRTGKHNTEETNRKNSLAHLGKKPSNEAKEKMSLNSNKAKQIRCLETNTIYRSVVYAARELNTSAAIIHYALKNNKTSPSLGLTFAYMGD